MEEPIKPIGLMQLTPDKLLHLLFPISDVRERMIGLQCTHDGKTFELDIKKIVKSEFAGWDFHHRCFALYIEHPDIPIVEDYGPVPNLFPLMLAIPAKEGDDFCEVQFKYIARLKEILDVVKVPEKMQGDLATMKNLLNTILDAESWK